MDIERTEVSGLELSLIRSFSVICLGVGWAAVGLYLYAASCATWPAYCIPNGTFSGYPILGGVAIVAGTVIQWSGPNGPLDFAVRCVCGLGAGVGLFGLSTIFGALLGG